MTKYMLISLLGLLGLNGLVSETTDPIGSSFLVKVSYDGDENFKKIGFKLKPQKGEFHYKAYLPKVYGERPDDRFPVLFISSPGGNVNIDQYSSLLEELEVIGIGLQEAKNGPWEPIMGNFLSAHDEVMKRFRVNETRKFATGFSGGARRSTLFAQVREGFAGVVLQGAGYWFDDETNTPYGFNSTPRGLRVYMIMGKSDNNFIEVERTKKGLRRNVKFKSEIIEGGHTPPPQEKLIEGLKWVMLQEDSNDGSSAEEEVSEEKSEEKRD